MITLFQFPAAFNVPNASPYCLKLETWLRLAGLEYQVKVVSDPRKAPKGKLPYVRIEGEAIGDSEIVIRTSASATVSLSTPAWMHGARAGHGRSRACATNTCTT